MDAIHDDIIKWKHFPHYWPFVMNSPVNSPHKGQWREALMFSLICAWTNGLVNNRKRWWFEMPSCSLWRHCNGNFLMMSCHYQMGHQWNSCFIGAPSDNGMTSLRMMHHTLIVTVLWWIAGGMNVTSCWWHRQTSCWSLCCLIMEHHVRFVGL